MKNGKSRGWGRGMVLDESPTDILLFLSVVFSGVGPGLGGIE